MSDYLLESKGQTPGAEAKAQIKNRHKVSRWFGRTMLAVGMGSGLLLAHGATTNNATETNAALGLILGSAGVGVAENLAAKKAMANTETDFRYLHSHDSGMTRTQVVLSNGTITDTQYIDYRSMSRFERLSPVLQGAGDAAAGFGTLLASGASWAERAPIPNQGTTLSLGVGMLAVGAASYFLGEMVDSQAVNSSLRRIDNMEHGLTMVVPPSTPEQI